MLHCFFFPFRRTGTNINTNGVDRASARRRSACPPAPLLNGWKRREEMDGKLVAICATRTAFTVAGLHCVKPAQGLDISLNSSKKQMNT